MLRLKAISTLLLFIAAILVFSVFILHFLVPSYEHSSQLVNHSHKRLGGKYLLPYGWGKKKPTTVFIPAEPNRSRSQPTLKCRENLVTIEQYRSRPIVRGVIVRFPSLQSDYYFVQFRWFYRSWIESEMFTLDRWRTDIIVLLDDRFPTQTRKLLEHLNCQAENQRASRRQISRCIIVNHKLLTQRPQIQRRSYVQQFAALDETSAMDENIDRLFAIYDHIRHFNRSHSTVYDFLMVTTMNSFLTTQFGKYIPVKCSFLIGKPPDYSTWYGKTDQMIQFAHDLLSTLKVSHENKTTISIQFLSTIEQLKQKFLFTENQVDISCDSKTTTYRTSVYHLKCYAHSTSLFSERMFREKAYDGYEKEPFNIYIAREYATLMALQSKVMSLDDLRALALNVTRREVVS